MYIENFIYNKIKKNILEESNDYNDFEPLSVEDLFDQINNNDTVLDEPAISDNNNDTVLDEPAISYHSKDVKNNNSIQKKFQEEINKPLDKKDLNILDVKKIENDKKLTKYMIKLAKIGFCTITLGTLLLCLKFDKKENINGNDIKTTTAEIVNSIETKEPKEAPAYIKHIVEKSAVQENEPEQENEQETNSAPKKTNYSIDKDLKTMSLSNELLEKIMANENISLLNGTSTYATPKWDVDQWTVGYGTCVYGYMKKKGSKSKKPWIGEKNTWVTDFRKEYGGIEENENDSDPTKEFPKGKLSEQTARAAFLYFIERSSFELFKSNDYILLNLPNSLKDALIDMSLNMGGSVLKKFPKASKILVKIANIYKSNKKLDDKNKNQVNEYIKRFVKELSRGKNENTASDYFIQSHYNIVNARLKSKSKELKNFRKKINNNKNNKETIERNKRYLKQSLDYIYRDTRFRENIILILNVSQELGKLRNPKSYADAFLKNLTSRIQADGKSIAKENNRKQKTNEEVIRNYIRSLLI